MLCGWQYLSQETDVYAEILRDAVTDREMPPPRPAMEARSGSLEPGRPSQARSANMCHPMPSIHLHSLLLAGVSGHLLDRLQSILNAAARLVFSARRSERITPLLRDLHWLRVPERIQFGLCILAFRCLNALAPPYLAESVRRTADACCPVSVAINSW